MTSCINVCEITLTNGETVTVNFINGVLGRVGQDGHAWFAIGKEGANFDISEEDYEKPYFVVGEEIDGKMKYNTFLIRTEHVASIRMRVRPQVGSYERS